MGVDGVNIHLSDTINQTKGETMRDTKRRTRPTQHDGFKVGDKVENRYKELLVIVEFDEDKWGDIIAVLSDNSCESCSDLYKV